MFMNEKLYIYLKNYNQELDTYIKSLPNQDSFFYENRLYIIEINTIYHDDYLDMLKAIEYDFYEDMRVFVDYINLPVGFKDSIQFFLSESSKGVYFLGDLIGLFIIKGNQPYKDLYKNYIESLLNKPTIDSGLVFVETSNVIVASKKLYIHRNTLNYRIDLIKNKTSLDLKKFKDAFAFYGLFN